MSPEFFEFVIQELLEHGDIGRVSELKHYPGEKEQYPQFLNNLKEDREQFFFPLSVKNLKFHPIYWGQGGRMFKEPFVSMIVTVWPNDEYYVGLEITFEELLTKFNTGRTYNFEN